MLTQKQSVKMRVLARQGKGIKTIARENDRAGVGGLAQHHPQVPLRRGGFAQVPAAGPAALQAGSVQGLPVGAGRGCCRRHDVGAQSGILVRVGWLFLSTVYGARSTSGFTGHSRWSFQKKPSLRSGSPLPATVGPGVGKTPPLIRDINASYGFRRRPCQITAFQKFETTGIPFLQNH